MSGEAQAAESTWVPSKEETRAFVVMDQEPTHIAVAHLGEGDLLAGRT
jgi:hypothetical protein